MSKIGELLKIVKGYHIMSNGQDDGLRDYHRCKEAISRKRDVVDRLKAAREALKDYRVMISLRADGVRVFNPETKAEVIL